jgi:7-cyano-7-deazaguanine synthase in queuosine biosynthesis
MLVCFSGGCDSTLVLSKLIDDSEKNTKLGEPIVINTISFVHPQLGHWEQEKQARSRILDELHRRHDITINHTEVNIDFDTEKGSVKCYSGLSQPEIWMQACGFLDENEDLYMGYIRTDDIWHFKEPLMRVFNGIQEIANKYGKLITPLEWHEKKDVLRELKQKNLLDLCWYCQDPIDNKPCGKCHSCMLYNMSLPFIDFVDEEVQYA